MGPTTPKRISKAIRDLCSELVSDADPEYVTVTPASDAKELDCFPTVERQVVAHGGEACYGWRIWELPWAYIQAEFHAVWRTAAGELVDVTPPPVSVSRILFVPDPARTYEGRQVNNVRRTLTADPSVDELFRAEDDEYEFWNRGTRAAQHGKINLGVDAAELTAIQERRQAALSKVLRAVAKPGRNGPCPCGSQKKFKRCCGA